jgi:uncharacterized protein (DUF433 family)
MDYPNGQRSTRGAYQAERAAALSGVPLSTLYYWARHDIYVPSVSSSKVKLWSWADLLALRAIYWLRSHKVQALRPTAMNEVRETLAAIEEKFGRRMGEALAGKSVVLRVDGQGHCYLEVEDLLVRPVGRDALQKAAPELTLDLLAQFDMEEQRGPHLLTPRPRLRIVPGKLGGEPHVGGTRLETRTIRGLLQANRSIADIIELYPFLEAADVTQASDLEEQLEGNLRKGIAA